jgi:hypothetical protein
VKFFVAFTLPLLMVLMMPSLYRTAWHVWAGNGSITTPEQRQAHESFFITFLVGQAVLLSGAGVLVIRRLHRSRPHNKTQQPTGAPSGAGG